MIVRMRINNRHVHAIVPMHVPLHMRTHTHNYTPAHPCRHIIQLYAGICTIITINTLYIYTIFSIHTPLYIHTHIHDYAPAHLSQAGQGQGVNETLSAADVVPAVRASSGIIVTMIMTMIMILI